jgi:putative transposase
VVMPVHVHLLFSEPERGHPWLMLAALKQSFSHRLLRELRVQTSAHRDTLWSTSVAAGHVWQRRFYDFAVFTQKKRVEKLDYMPRNPVRRGLALRPEQWRWSSFAITRTARLGRFWSMRRGQRSFRAAKSREPTDIAAHP